jgi:hypothetical protein
VAVGDVSLPSGFSAGAPLLGEGVEERSVFVGDTLVEHAWRVAAVLWLAPVAGRAVVHPPSIAAVRWCVGDVSRERFDRGGGGTGRGGGGGGNATGCVASVVGTLVAAPCRVGFRSWGALFDSRWARGNGDADCFERRVSRRPRTRPRGRRVVTAGGGWRSVCRRGKRVLTGPPLRHTTSSSGGATFPLRRAAADPM